MAEVSLPAALVARIVELTGASELRGTEALETLWSGYGHIVRCHLEGAAFPSVIVKHVRWPTEADHPRGWNSNRSHLRKVRSYEVESHWYGAYASRCDDTCRVPRCLTAESHGDEIFLVLEDLDAAGFPERRREASGAEMRACLSWLAHFHARFLGEAPRGLWRVGTYWHLATRPDELDALEDGPLKRGAAAIDRRLSDARFLTLVHGDAKLANFCFSPDGRAVAAVDFQYVGGGCGMKDVAYFISSCLYEAEAEEQEAALLDHYFGCLELAVGAAGVNTDLPALVAEWRELYPVAWADFYRFLKGWSPGHWKMHRYSERLTREVLASL